MSKWPESLAAETFHGRHGVVRNAFRYKVDYVLIDPETQCGPRLFARNRLNFVSVHDRDHGGPRGAGMGLPWARAVLAARGLAEIADRQILLLTQPRFLGFVFNPVSFWLAFEGTMLLAVIAEVNNTFGDRHCYLCRRPDFAPLGAADQLIASKVFHVSPFQDVAGTYTFTFDISAAHIAIRIAHANGPEQLVATLSGERRPLTDRAILGAALRRPFGALRTVALIHWQALRLGMKGARCRRRPTPPIEEVTECNF